MANLLYRIGRSSAMRPLIAIIAWVLALGAAGGGFVAFGGTLTDSFSIPGLETERVANELSEEIQGLDGGTANAVFQTTDGSAITDEQADGIAQALATAEDTPSVVGIVEPFATEAQIADQTAQLEDAPQQIADGRAQAEAGQAQIDAGRAELEAGQAQLDAQREAAEAQLEAGQAQIDAGQEQLDAGQAQLDAAIEEAKEAGTYEFAQAQFEAQQAQLDANQAELDAAQEEIDRGVAELDAAQQQIDDGLAELEAAQEELDEGLAELDAAEAALETRGPLAEAAADMHFVSGDGTTARGMIRFATPIYEVVQEDKTEVMETVSANVPDGIRVDFSADIATSVEGVMGAGEVIGVGLAFIVLLVMMRALLPAIQPIVTSVLGVGVGALTALAFSGTVEMSSVTPVLGVMLGLAVGIDYSLFIVNRHRKQVRAGMNVHESAGLANGTSGNAVVFAGVTVMIALLALNVTGVPFLGIMGTVAAFSVLVAVLVAITLTPAVLGLLGTRVVSRKARASIGAPEHAEPPVKPMRTATALVAFVAAAAALLVIAIPAMSMRLGLPDGLQEPQDSTQYVAYTTIDQKFGEGVNGTLLVTARLPEGTTEQEAVAAQVDIAMMLMENEDVTVVSPAGDMDDADLATIGISDDYDFLAFQVIPREGPSSESTAQLVHDLRDLSPLDDGTEIGVAGQASGNIDVSEKLDSVLPLYLAIVVGLSVVILIVVFRSLLVPIIATAGFVLSLFAAFGAVTAVYQWGWLGSLFGVHDPGPVLSFLPILLTGILFGLAMDYQLFITVGMREAFAHGSTARESVMAGLRHGRAVVTAAAIIMISVFGGFVFSHIATIRAIGFGLAVGVLFDAFLVRMVIVPSLMHLVGNAAWWMPAWLDRLLPNVDVEGSELERAHPVPHAVEGDEPGGEHPAGSSTGDDAEAAKA
ncbi:MMPL family transporter [Demequina pelophila]|uniref:MMPL family transporter n=1 Tax=Demequina pelophila TaxID=1638984 RepID=UPI000781F162|nr:MMPL family transporter [Demequina pelophila]